MTVYTVKVQNWYDELIAKRFRIRYEPRHTGRTNEETRDCPTLRISPYRIGDILWEEFDGGRYIPSAYPVTDVSVSRELIPNHKEHQLKGALLPLARDISGKSLAQQQIDERGPSLTGSATKRPHNEPGLALVDALPQAAVDPASSLKSLLTAGCHGAGDTENTFANCFSPGHPGGNDSEEDAEGEVDEAYLPCKSATTVCQNTHLISFSPCSHQ